MDTFLVIHIHIKLVAVWFQVWAIFSEPAPEHSCSVQPIIELEPAHQGSGSAGSVQVRT